MTGLVCGRRKSVVDSKFGITLAVSGMTDSFVAVGGSKEGREVRSAALGEPLGFRMKVVINRHAAAVVNPTTQVIRRRFGAAGCSRR